MEHNTTLIIVLLGAIAVVVGIVFTRRSKEHGEDPVAEQLEQAAPVKVIEETQQAQEAEQGFEPRPLTHEEAVDLSESGTVFVFDEIDRCVKAGQWDEAVEWSLHAILSRPDRVEFKVKLAEVYHQAEMNDKFVLLFEELIDELEDPSELRAQLLEIAEQIIPSHILEKRIAKH